MAEKKLVAVARAVAEGEHLAVKYLVSFRSSFRSVSVSLVESSSVEVRLVWFG